MSGQLAFCFFRSDLIPIDTAEHQFYWRTHIKKLFEVMLDFFDVAIYPFGLRGYQDTFSGNISNEIKQKFSFSVFSHARGIILYV